MRTNVPGHSKAITRVFLTLILLLTTGCQLFGVVNRKINPSEPADGTTTNDAEWYQVHFTQPSSPEAALYRGGPAEVLVNAIKSARLSVEIASYGLNLWSVRDALLNAQQRGVMVRIVTDGDNLAWEEVQDLASAGIPVVSDYSDSLMHNKFFIIDRQQVFTGSMNPTVGGAYYDNNNLIAIRSSRLAEYYGMEFGEMFSDHLFSRASPSANASGTLDLNGDRIEVFFSPEASIAKRIIELINGASSSIYFLAYSFTSNEIADAMIRRYQDGLDVGGVMERSQYYSNEGTEFDRLRSAGIDVRLDGNLDNMHHKIIILDEQIVVTGSYNFSRNAEELNDENILILHLKELAAIYMQEYERIWVESQDDLD